MSLTPQSVAEAIASVAPPSRESFIPTRWTNHTYAYDYLRSHPTAFGITSPELLSRAGAAGWLEANLADPDTKEEICALLARGYFKEYNVAVPFCTFCDQPLVKTLGSDIWLNAAGDPSCSSRDSVPGGRLHQAA